MTTAGWCGSSAAAVSPPPGHRLAGTRHTRFMAHIHRVFLRIPVPFQLGCALVVPFPMSVCIRTTPRYEWGCATQRRARVTGDTNNHCIFSISCAIARPSWARHVHHCRPPAPRRCCSEPSIIFARSHATPVASPNRRVTNARTVAARAPSAAATQVARRRGSRPQLPPRLQTAPVPSPARPASS